ncbi:MAG TPA: hypothetical protein VIH99_12260 [Bdellovibrionota bacterium]|jgi:hypothetical protein
MFRLFLLCSWLLSSPAEACRFTQENLKTGLQLHRRNSAVLQTLEAKLKTMEVRCETVHTKLASGSAQSAEAQSCEALAESAKMNERLSQASKLCEQEAAEIVVKVTAFREELAGPQATDAADFLKTIEADEFLRAQCKNEISQARSLSQDTQALLARSIAAQAKIQEFTKQYGELSSTTKAFEGVNASAYARCRLADSSVEGIKRTPAPSGAKLSPKVLPKAQKKGVSDITGTEKIPHPPAGN